jgi:hypothetical protein
MPAIPQTPVQPVSPAAPGAPPSPANEPPFGVPPGETIYSNAPSYEPPLPPDASRSKAPKYLAAALVVVILVLAVLVVIGMIH